MLRIHQAANVEASKTDPQYVKHPYSVYQLRPGDRFLVMNIDRDKTGIVGKGMWVC
jgi:hypothetical protein